MYASALALARALAKGPEAAFATAGPKSCKYLLYKENGGGGIRTHEGLRPPVFKTGALNRSATPPGAQTKRSASIPAPGSPHRGSRFGWLAAGRDPEAALSR